MKIPCELCIVRSICKTGRAGGCPDLDRWIRLSPVERYLEKHPQSSLNKFGTFRVSMKA